MIGREFHMHVSTVKKVTTWLHLILLPGFQVGKGGFANATENPSMPPDSRFQKAGDEPPSISLLDGHGGRCRRAGCRLRLFSPGIRPRF
jgi:hypothetical protein